MRTTDKEQVEMLRQWWNDYGKSIAIAIVIGLIVGLGWRYWRQHQVDVASQASSLYQSMLASAQQKDSAQSQRYADDLINQYARSPYATLAALFSAKTAIAANDLQQALNKLQWVVDHSKSAQFKQSARLRAARILLQQNKAQQALDLLAVVDDKAYQPLIDHIKGDAYTLLGNAASAKAAYEAAKKGLTEGGVEDPLLNMKLSQ